MSKAFGGQNKLEEQMNPDAGLDQVVRLLAGILYKSLYIISFVVSEALRSRRKSGSTVGVGGTRMSSTPPPTASKSWLAAPRKPWTASRSSRTSATKAWPTSRSVRCVRSREPKGSSKALVREKRVRLRAGRPQAELFRARLSVLEKGSSEDILDEALDFERKVLEKQRAP